MAVRNLFQTFLVTLSIGLVVFCVAVIFNNGLHHAISDRHNPNKSKTVAQEQNRREAEKIGGKIADKVTEGINSINNNMRNFAEEKSKEEQANRVPEQDSRFERTEYNYADDDASNQQFAIQLGYFKPQNVKLDVYATLNDLGKLYTTDGWSNNKRVLLGNYTTRSQAEAALTEAKLRGFQDAFITATKAPISTMGGGLANGSHIMIQLSAQRSFIVDSFKDVTALGAIWTDYDASLDITRVLIGPFKSAEAAQTALKTLRNSGYNKAYTRNIAINNQKNLTQILAQSNY